MMTKLPSMPFYPADFFADTEHLPASARHAYLFLLCHAWLRGGKLPNDDAALARMAGFRLDRWRKLKPDVMRFWNTGEDGMLWNARQLITFQAVHAKREVNIANGAHGGTAKAMKNKGRVLANGSNSVPYARAFQNQNQIKKDSLNGELRQEAPIVSQEQRDRCVKLARETAAAMRMGSAKERKIF